MKTKTYVTLSAGLTIIWVLALLLVPAFADTVEGLMLLFLSTSA